MPKKMGTNSKAVEARERKAAVKQAEKMKIEKQKEDELWRDDDPKLAKKKQQKVISRRSLLLQSCTDKPLQ